MTDRTTLTGLAKLSDHLVLERHLEEGLKALKDGNDRKLMASVTGIKNIRMRSEEMWSDQVKEYAYSELEFTLRDLYTALNASTIQQKNAIRKSLQRLKEEKVVEHKGRGIYRVIEGDLVEMILKPTEEIQEIPIDWPLNIHSHFVTYAKSAIVIAGTKDAGKTAFFIDFIKRNMKRHEIHYFNSEMGENEFSMRLNAHRDMEIDDWTFKAYERSDKFQDVIFPDAINIIDYIEENENLMKMGDKIKTIHDKLNKGIALIGLQKDFGATLGRGRGFTLQRPRLYVTMEHNPTENYGTARCLAAKTKRHEDSGLAGMEVEYRVREGWEFKQTLPYWRPMTSDPYGSSYQRGSGR